MPLVHVSANAARFAYADLGKVCEVLPRIVSKALSVDGEGKLTPEDIMVDAKADISHLGRNNKDLGILILAHDYPERRENLDERRRLMEICLEPFIPPGKSWYVWIWLGCTSYGSDTTK